jgi:hypothetical protein
MLLNLSTIEISPISMFASFGAAVHCDGDTCRGTGAPLTHSNERS